MKKKTEKDLEQFKKSARYTHIKKMQKRAVALGLCEEMVDGKCMYPHCCCLYGLDRRIEIEAD